MFSFFSFCVPPFKINLCPPPPFYFFSSKLQKSNLICQYQLIKLKSLCVRACARVSSYAMLPLRLYKSLQKRKLPIPVQQLLLLCCYSAGCWKKCERDCLVDIIFHYSLLRWSKAARVSFFCLVDMAWIVSSFSSTFLLLQWLRLIDCIPLIGSQLQNSVSL
jgi:hypothetical protein